MKTKKFSLTVLALAFIVSAFATEVPKMNVVTLNNSKVYVAALTSAQFPSEVTLFNSDGDIVYYKRSKAASQFRSVLNLKQLENGTYTICLKTGKVLAQRSIEVNKGAVRVKQAVKEIAPVFSHKNGMVHVTYLNPNQTDVSVMVYKNNLLVQESKLGCDFNIQRCFDVSNFSQGDFEFVLCGNNLNYNYQVLR